VTDESLSFVRCGAALFSHTIPGFTPDLVIIGKGIGCSLLLLRETLPGADYVRIIVERAFSLIAFPLTLLQACCTLRVMSEVDIASRCKQQCAAMLQQLQKIPGVKARGVGLCLWVDNGLEQLPIAACIHGRLLAARADC
jgi:4-aminobutyrate aminotransferase-like enzyme